jgi:hypothetical protein
MFIRIERAIPVCLAVAALALVFVLAVPGVSLAKTKVECTKFKPANITVSRTSSGYAVTEFNKSILQVGGSRAEARLALHLMQFYSMTRVCRVAGTEPAFTYYKSGEKSPRGAVAGEDCVGFNPKKVRYVKKGNTYFLVEGSHSIVALGKNEGAAKKVRSIVREIGFNNICYVGRPQPSMVYFRK